jgi:farnesyl diphosphate synthase
VPSKTPDFQTWMGQVQTRMEDALKRLLPTPDIAPSRLHQSMRYAVLGGGKRVRPLLCFAAGEISGAPAERLEFAAAAVEMIHAYSLIHDDLPCMDDDVLRRGKPTCHVEYDEATALLAGDSLQALAFQVLAENAVAPDASTQLRMLFALAHAAGSRGMAGGQAIDLYSVGKSLALEELEFMHIHKTGALIRAAVLLGALCGDALDVAQLERVVHFAHCVGLAFQVVDDVLDCEASTATLGKTAGKDVASNKPTYVSALGLQRSKEWAESLRIEARDAVTGFGSEADRLRQVADFIVLRKF